MASSFKDPQYYLVYTGVVMLVTCLVVALNWEDVRRDSTGPVIGFVSESTNDVRSKSHDELAWNNSFRGQKLSAGDSIFAGEKSEAIFEFNNGAKLKVHANSLIVLGDKENEIQLGAGYVTGMLRTQEVIKVKVGRRIIQLRSAKGPAEVEVRQVGETYEITSASEGVSAVVDDQEVKIDAHVTQITDVGIAAPSVAPNLLPEPPQLPVANAIPPANVEKPRQKRSFSSTVDEIPRSIAAAPPEELPPTEVNVPMAAPKTKARRKFQMDFTAGIGMNYVDFAQTGTEVNDLQYGSMQGPNYSLRAEGLWDNGLSLGASYGTYPGQLQSQRAIIQNSKFNWVAMGLEAGYRFPIEIGLGESEQLKVVLGLQRHQMPYVQIQDFDRALVREMVVTMASLGADYSFRWGRAWRPQLLMRYNYPVAQSANKDDELSLDSKFAFDGSLGVDYRLTPKTKLGLFWYGQWQEYDYRMRSEISGEMDSGASKLFFSTMEFRFGYTY